MNVMYFSYQPYFLDLAEIMEEKGWLPVYWSVVPSSRDAVKSKYPNVICHDHYDAMKGILPQEYQNKLLPALCPSFLHQLIHAERISMRMLDRNDSHTNTFSYRERLKLFQKLVQYWKMVVEDLDPKYVVFEEEPHQISDYVLYEVCKLMGVETIMFIRTNFHERMYPIHKFIISRCLSHHMFHEQIMDLIS